MAFFNFVFATDSEPMRLDRFLTTVLPQYSREFLKKCRLEVNSAAAKPSQKLQPGDQIRIAVPALKDLKIEPENIPLEIIEEDAEILIINKPAGLVVHPTDHGGHVTGTLVNALLWYFKKSPKTPLFQRGEANPASAGRAGGFRPGLVHRLDRDTSGLMVIAKTETAKEKLGAQFQNREVQKEYLALVAGILKTDAGRIDAPIGRGDTDRTRRAVKLGGDAREAITEFEVVQRFSAATLVKVRILTGRTHQIRVHMASLGHPVVGDELYGSRKINAKFDLTRQFLHAGKLAFTHPATGARVEFTAPLPADLERALDGLK